MIGPDMFDEFVKPELQASCDKLENAFYHLDGPGELPHLDSLLEIQSLKGVQWIPGAGAADNTQWADVYRKISDAGKKLQLFSAHSEKPFEDVFDAVADQIGRADNIVYMIDEDIKERDRVEKFLARFM
jgi:5-methyltetrahydrofolate--homocysteine methyltransferase